MPWYGILGTMFESLWKAISENCAVDAIVLGGSRTGLGSDAYSDYDLTVYSQEPLDLVFRTQLADRFAEQAEVGNDYFGPGDELLLADGTYVDIMYHSLAWAKQEVSQIWVQCQARVGYTTAFIHSLRTSRILYDREGRFALLKQQLAGPYPPALRKAIIEKNLSLLRSKLTASFFEQIEHAIQRCDVVSQVHRTTALLNSYFDVLFALNKQTHPGEKRLVSWVKESCTLIPPSFESDIQAVSQSIGQPGLLENLTVLLDHLDELLQNELHTS